MIIAAFIELTVQCALFSTKYSFIFANSWGFFSFWTAKSEQFYFDVKMATATQQKQAKSHHAFVSSTLSPVTAIPVTAIPDNQFSTTYVTKTFVLFTEKAER